MEIHDKCKACLIALDSSSSKVERGDKRARVLCSEDQAGNGLEGGDGKEETGDKEIFVEKLVFDKLEGEQVYSELYCQMCERCVFPCTCCDSLVAFKKTSDSKYASCTCCGFIELALPELRKQLGLVKTEIYVLDDNTVRRIQRNRNEPSFKNYVELKFKELAQAISTETSERDLTSRQLGFDEFIKPQLLLIRYRKFLLEIMHGPHRLKDSAPVHKNKLFDEIDWTLLASLSKGKEVENALSRLKQFLAIKQDFDQVVKESKVLETVLTSKLEPVETEAPSPPEQVSHTVIHSFITSKSKQLSQQAAQYRDPARALLWDIGNIIYSLCEECVSSNKKSSIYLREIHQKLTLWRRAYFLLWSLCKS
mmetsp:Transcript_19555/g.32629  ORF Transcript_19555/g.32629 Transcript_19555/m.32629 type:complete len:366 (+) Transcript_19555:1299-2396(+)